MNFRAILFVVAFAAAAVFVSCSDDTCYDQRSALPTARFYYKGGTTAVAVSGLTVGGIGAAGDSLIVDSTTVSEFYMPLAPHETECRYFLRFTIAQEGVDSETGETVTTYGHLTDTLTVQYTAKPYFASRECGAMFYFDIANLTTTRHILDSVAVVTPTITNVSRENFRLFLPNDDNDDE